MERKVGDPPYHVSEEDALSAIASYEGLVIVDLDETLYLQNSTTNFLDCASPGILAMVLLKILSFIAPWRWTEGDYDTWRVCMVQRWFPRTMSRWQERCKNDSAKLTNIPLLEALRARRQPFVIATNGFYPIVAPLVEEMGCGDVKLIACRLGYSTDRLIGKAELVRSQIGAADIKSALFITDSLDDADLLHRCNKPCLTRWRAASNPRLFGKVYFPGLYTAVVKRSAHSGINTVLVNQLFWLLAPLTVGFNVRTLLAAIPFFWSFWSVYEAGYRDNDICASLYEEDPVLSPSFDTFRQENFERNAWLFALCLGALGVMILGKPVLFPVWIVLLAATRGTFWLYNRFDKSTRVWLYLPMQLQRELSFLVFASASFVGVSAVAARAIAKWIEYIVYRYARTVGVRGFTKMPLRFYRLFLFIVMIGVGATLDISAILFALLFLANARTEIAAAIKAGYRIDKN